MKEVLFVLAVVAVLLGCGWAEAVQQAGAPPTSATDVTNRNVLAAVAAAPEGRVSDQQIRMVDAGGYNVGIGVVQRPPTTTGGAIQHHKQTEIYRVLEGVGTLVTGGMLVEGRSLDPDGSTVRELTGPSSVGSGIQGGESRRIEAGDMVIIPAGVPHGFTEIQETITYLVIRVDPEQVVELK